MPRLSREERKARKQKRREERQLERGQARKLVDIAFEVYEDGDGTEDLREKITERLEEDFGSGKLGILLELLEKFLPLILRLIMGV